MADDDVKFRAAAAPASVRAPLIAIVALTAIGMASVVLVFWLRPDKDNTALIVNILGFIAPTTMALLAYLKAQETHLSVNSRLDEMMRNASRVARAEGLEEGRIAGRDVADARTDQIAAEKKAGP